MTNYGKSNRDTDAIHSVDEELSNVNCASSDSSIDNPRLSTVRRELEAVVDPEIPALNVIEMGIIADVRIEGDGVVVEVTPTFAGCPALDVIRDDIRRAVAACGEASITVKTVYDPPWTTERMTDEARRKLKEFGLAPPGKRCAEPESPVPQAVPCPNCNSTRTEMESLFGPTLCRSIHYCHECRQSFEHFKAVESG